MSFLVALKTWISGKALSFVLAHWEVLALLFVGLLYLVSLHFVPALERPTFFVAPIIGLALGAVIDRKYLRT